MPADKIYDRSDNSTKGVVSYSPTAEVDLVRVSATYDGVNQVLWLEWCPVVGAVQYHVYESASGWPDPATDLRLLSTTDLTTSIPVPATSLHRNYRVTAELSGRGGCR